MPPLRTALACLWTCPHAGATFAAYSSANLLWNTALLLLTSHGSALHAFLALKLQVPLVALLSVLPWPLIGSHPASPLQWATLLAMTVGIAGFQCGKRRAARRLALRGAGCCSRHGDANDAAEVGPKAEAERVVAGLPYADHNLMFGPGTHSLKEGGSAAAAERVRIYDGRAAPSRFRLQQHSFELVRAPSYQCNMCRATRLEQPAHAPSLPPPVVPVFPPHHRQVRRRQCYSRLVPEARAAVAGQAARRHARPAV